MRTIKLTENEYVLLLKGPKMDKPFVCGKFDLLIDVLDVDKFREFVNDEIKALPRPLNEPSRKQYNLYKNIISKLL